MSASESSRIDGMRRNTQSGREPWLTTRHCSASSRRQAVTCRTAPSSRHCSSARGGTARGSSGRDVESGAPLQHADSATSAATHVRESLGKIREGIRRACRLRSCRERTRWPAAVRPTGPPPRPRAWRWLRRQAIGDTAAGASSGTNRSRSTQLAQGLARRRTTARSTLAEAASPRGGLRRDPRRHLACLPSPSRSSVTHVMPLRPGRQSGFTAHRALECTSGPRPERECCRRRDPALAVLVRCPSALDHQLTSLEPRISPAR